MIHFPIEDIPRNKAETATYLLLTSFSNEMSLSYPNSPPNARGKFTISACVATSTTLNGFLIFPPNAKKQNVQNE